MRAPSAPPASGWLLLFDIDGTLLRCGREVGVAFFEALEAVFGAAAAVRARDAAPGYSFAGRTDPRIVIDLMGAAGVSREEAVAGLAAVRATYLERLAERFDGSRTRVLPGVEALLARLARRGDVTLALLTGNWEGGARVKLESARLGGYFGFGAFGDDGIERHELPPVALARASAARGGEAALDRVLVIGDTRHDVDCARAHGLSVLAVATGREDEASLHAAGASWVTATLEHLPDLPPFALGSPG
ncbi:MAG TPA: haloacid dehalogenase-like hydrolase [Thermoanaerobaculia bacterium]|nr:haloacid dehalogenase-like hydrolase [Thermoanaerobaculia bacterium]